MADVDIQCMSCANQITVSDVVDISKLKCRACGGEFLRSDAEPEQTETQAQKPEEKRRSLMGRTKTAPAVNAAAAAEQQDQSSNEQQANRLAWEKLNNPEARAAVEKQSSKMYSALTWRAWATFIGIALIAGGLRYSGLIPEEILQQAAIYEAITFIIFYVIIVLKAFQDSVFQGVLCFLLPPYSFYYLFSASDDFYLRAFIAGVMVGIGQDAGFLIHEWSMVAIEAANKWIASGG